MRVRRHRLAKFLGVLSIAVGLLTALSLVVNHIELSLSVRGDPPNAGIGSIESTSLQAGFRNGRLYVERTQWKRPDPTAPLMHSYSLPSMGPLDWLIRVSDSKQFNWDELEINVNGWMLAAALAIYPLCVVVASLARRLRREHGNTCRACGYALTGNLSGVCPECGSATPESPSGKPACDASPIMPAKS